MPKYEVVSSNSYNEVVMGKYEKKSQAQRIARALKKSAEKRAEKFNSSHDTRYVKQVPNTITVRLERL